MTNEVIFKREVNETFCYDDIMLYVLRKIFLLMYPYFYYVLL